MQELGTSPGDRAGEGEAVGDSEAPTPRGGWGERGWMAGVQMRSTVLRWADWTASGALDWDFPRSAEGGKTNKKRETEGSRRERKERG